MHRTDGGRGGAPPEWGRDCPAQPVLLAHLCPPTVSQHLSRLTPSAGGGWSKNPHTQTQISLAFLDTSLKKSFGSPERGSSTPWAAPRSTPAPPPGPAEGRRQWPPPPPPRPACCAGTTPTGGHPAATLLYVHAILALAQCVGFSKPRKTWHAKTSELCVTLFIHFLKSKRYFMSSGNGLTGHARFCVGLATVFLKKMPAQTLH